MIDYIQKYAHKLLASRFNKGDKIFNEKSRGRERERAGEHTNNRTNKQITVLTTINVVGVSEKVDLFDRLAVSWLA